MIDSSDWLGRIYVGDCLEFMRQLPDGCVDAVVTDPPYGINVASWDAEVPVEALRECLRVSIGPLVAFGGASTAVMEKVLALRPERCYIWLPRFTLSKTNSNGTFWRWHPVWCWRPPKDGREAMPFDWFDDPCDGHNWWNHPATKPLKVMERLVAFVDSQVIFDPFLGSGTTAVACERLGRKWLGCEINPEYAAMAEKRIAKERAQLKLDMVVA